MLEGRVDGEDVVLVRRGGEFFAVGASYRTTVNLSCGGILD